MTARGAFPARLVTRSIAGADGYRRPAPDRSARPPRRPPRHAAPDGLTDRVDYLGLVAARINYTDLPRADEPDHKLEAELVSFTALHTQQSKQFQAASCPANSGTFAALYQGIALRYAMNGMETTETKTYLARHLKLAGRSDPLSSDDAAELTIKSAAACHAL